MIFVEKGKEVIGKIVMEWLVLLFVLTDTTGDLVIKYLLT